MPKVEQEPVSPPGRTRKIFAFFFLSLLLPVKDRRKWNQLTPSKDFSGLNSVLYCAVEILWFTDWTSALTERASFGLGFLTSVCLCVVFFCRLFDFLNVTTELLFEFLNYCRSNQEMLRSSVETSYFLENSPEKFPWKGPWWDCFLAAQGAGTELVILGAGLSLGLVPLPARLQQWLSRSLPWPQCLQEPCWALKAALCSCTAAFCAARAAQERGQGRWHRRHRGSAAHRAPFQQLRDSRGVLQEKNRICKVHLWKNSSSVLKIHLKISSERSWVKKVYCTQGNLFGVWFANNTKRCFF